MMKLVVPRGPGPWGGYGGKNWDDGVFKNVKDILVYIGTSINVVKAIGFEYQLDDGTTFRSPLYGCRSSDDIVKQVRNFIFFLELY